MRMDNLKEKLISMIQEAVGGCARHWASLIAAHLIANGVTVQEWIPVTERLPEPKENPVLVVYAGCVWAAWKHYNYWELVTGLNTTCVTHWMPLPPAPEAMK
jgi:hypothetical protein